MASGDPQSNGIVLWTRINPDFYDKETIIVEISDTPDFKSILISREEKINFIENFTVKSYIHDNKLRSWSKYYYRFRYKKFISPVGSFKTLPAKNQKISSIKFGVLNCQDYSTGNFFAHKYLAEEDIDFVLFLGDYIYEYSYDKGAKDVLRKLRLPSGNEIASGIEDYYYLYNSYRSDPYLKELHRKFPFIVIWDDHEYANDCYGYFAPDHFIKDEKELKKLRIQANKAWFFSMPVNVDFKPDKYDSIKAYRSFDFGTLAKIILTDERTFRSSHPCGEGRFDRYLTKGCDNEKSSNRTMLGSKQLKWFFDLLENSSQKWNIWANPVCFMKLKFNDRFISLDSWDGYQYERSLILNKIKKLKEENHLENIFILTGDLHSFVSGYAKLEDEYITAEFITTSATSSNLNEILPVDIDVDILEELIMLENEHLKYFNSSTNGYTIIEVKENYVDIVFKAVDIHNVKKGVKIKRKFRIYSGNVEFEEI